MRLRELLDGLDVAGWSGDPDVEVTSLTHDSRRVVPGACFACMPGARTDGHVHALEAVGAGAVALLTETVLDIDDGTTQAVFGDVRASLGAIASRFHGDPSTQLRVVGVTGTNGKTTTVTLLESIGESAGDRTQTIGTLGGALTTPEAPDLQALFASMRDEGTALVAMEVSSHALVRHRIDGTRFAVACFTNLSHDHLDEHRTMEDYFEAKRLLFAPGRAEVAVVNLDDTFGARLAADLTAQGRAMVTYGVHHPSARIGAESVVLDGAGSRFEIVDRDEGGQVSVSNQLLGEFNVSNQLAAAAIAVALGIGLDVVAEALATSPPVPGRLERFDGDGVTVLVDYAHTPDSLERALSAARLVGDDVTVVFGCGGDRDASKRPMMGAVAGRGADLVVLTDDNPRSEDPEAIIEAVASGTTAEVTVVIERDRAAAIAHAVSVTPKGGVVLVAGKGHETTQTIGGRTLDFDDRAVVRDVLGARRCA